MMEQSLYSCPLFDGIAPDEFEPLFRCLSAKRRVYNKDAFIFEAEEPAVWVGIVVSGGVHVIQKDFWGNRTILTYVRPGDMFGEAFSCAGIQRLPVSVVASETSEILLIDYRKIAGVSSSPCTYYARLISNMLRILANKNIQLTQKMEHLSKRSTREKLLSFLSARAVQTNSNELVIPFNRQELADYLCVERSALSRELGEMKKDGLLDYRKNRFVLL